MDDFGRVSTTKQISDLQLITEDEKQAQREITDILEINQEYWFIKMNEGEQNQNPSTKKWYFPMWQLLAKYFLKKKNVVVNAF